MLSQMSPSWTVVDRTHGPAKATAGNKNQGKMNHGLAKKKKKRNQSNTDIERPREQPTEEQWKPYWTCFVVYGGLEKSENLERMTRGGRSRRPTGDVCFRQLGREATNGWHLLSSNLFGRFPSLRTFLARFLGADFKNQRPYRHREFASRNSLWLHVMMALTIVAFWLCPSDRVPQPLSFSSDRSISVHPNTYCTVIRQSPCTVKHLLSGVVVWHLSTKYCNSTRKGIRVRYELGSKTNILILCKQTLKEGINFDISRV